MTEAASRTHLVTINAAFLQELKEVNQELWQLLSECRAFCEEPKRLAHHCTEFVQQLGELCDKLALHFALEEAYGYFDDPIAVAPQLAVRCHTLRGEHGALYVELATLVERCEQLSYERKFVHLAAQVPPIFFEFHQRLLEHESFEMELIQDAFAKDIGTGD